MIIRSDLRTAIVERLSAQGIPEWVRMALTAWQLGSAGSVSEVTAETRTFDCSFIEFLDEQIRLNPRGEAWRSRLVRRREALTDYVGRSLLCISISDGRREFHTRIRPDDLEVVLMEEFE